MTAHDAPERDRRLETALASLLERGTWLACAIVGIGLAVQWLAGAETLGLRVVTAGLAVFLALPILRLLTVCGALLRRDAAFAAIAAIVLAIIAIAFAVGAFVA